MSQPALFIRVVHTGFYADGRPNTHAVLINDLVVGYENQNRKVPVYVPYGGFIDIPASDLSLLSYSKGTIAKFASVGVVSATLFLRPASYSNATRPAAATFPVGVSIWNTDDTAPNYSDGVNWRNSTGSMQATYAATPAWFVSATGSSTASGTDVSHPITPAELSRRLAGLTLTVAGLMTIHYDAAGDPNGGLIKTWNLVPGTQMLVTGTPTLTGTTGTLTTWTTIDNTVTPASYGFADSALPAANSWSAFIGTPFITAPKRIRITSGARAGLCMAVLKDENTNTVPVPKTARVAPPYNNPAFVYPIQFYTPSLTVPVAGDPYVVEALPNIGWFRDQGANANGTAQIFFKDVAFTPAVGTSLGTPDGEFVSVYDCHIPWLVSMGPVALYGGSSDYAEVRSSLFQASGVGVTYQWELFAGAYADVSNCLFQGASLLVDPGARMSCSSAMQFFDVSGAPMTVQGWAYAAVLSGEKSTAAPIVKGGGHLTYSTLPTLQNNTGASLNVSVDSVVMAWSAVPYVDRYTASSVLATNTGGGRPQNIQAFPIAGSATSVAEGVIGRLSGSGTITQVVFVPNTGSAPAAGSNSQALAIAIRNGAGGGSSAVASKSIANATPCVQFVNFDLGVITNGTYTDGQILTFASTLTGTATLPAGMLFVITK